MDTEKTAQPFDPASFEHVPVLLPGKAACSLPGVCGPVSLEDTILL